MYVRIIPDKTHSKLVPTVESFTAKHRRSPRACRSVSRPHLSFFSSVRNDTDIQIKHTDVSFDRYHGRIHWISTFYITAHVIVVTNGDRRNGAPSTCHMTRLGTLPRRKRNMRDLGPYKSHRPKSAGNLRFFRPLDTGRTELRHPGAADPLPASCGSGSPLHPGPGQYIGIFRKVVRLVRESKLRILLPTLLAVSFFLFSLCTQVISNGCQQVFQNLTDRCAIVFDLFGRISGSGSPPPGPDGHDASASLQAP